MMRFKTGEKVEVMNNKEVPVSWRTAKILSSSGRAYTLQYDYHPGSGMARDRLVEMVPGKFVRPLAPPVQDVESFVTGAIVEVFYQYSWKIAAILNIVGGRKNSKKNKIHLKVGVLQNQYLVRLLGCSQELVVDRSNIRMRQMWRDGRWILIEKSSQTGNDVIASKPSTSNCCKNMEFQVPQFNARAQYRPKREFANIQDDAALRDSPVISARSLKRMSPYDSTLVEAHSGHVKKLRATEKEGLRQRVVADLVLEKVDAVAYPKETLGEKYMHASYNIISNGYNQMERAKQNNVRVRSSELNSSSSDACSVGSCSVTNQSLKNCQFMPVDCHETDTLCSDAESSYGSASERKNCSLPPKEELEVSVRRLELHAYRSTLEALYASGPLSWEQEALLTNLRIMLHISNDEHLKELKHLISTKTAICVR